MTGRTKITNFIKNTEYFESMFDGLPYGYFFGFRGGFHCEIISVELDGNRKDYKLDILYSGGKIDIDYSETRIPIIYEPLASCLQKPTIKAPNKQQAAAIAECLEVFRAHGSGKTFMRYALGLEYETTHNYPNYDPYHALHSFAYIYSKIAPTQKKPLIINIDEVDVVIDKIMQSEKVLDKNMPSSFNDRREFAQDASNKKEWCEFMDAFDSGVYPWVYLIMTTNRGRSYFDSLDPALFRDGRVNVIREFK